MATGEIAMALAYTSNTPDWTINVSNSSNWICYQFASVLQVVFDFSVRQGKTCSELSNTLAHLS